MKKMKNKKINKVNHPKMSFTDLCNEVQEKVFSRLKDENIDVENIFYIGVVLREESDDYINRMCIIDVENYLRDFGFLEALEIYDGEYGLDYLKGMEKIRRVKCLLQCALKDLLYDMDERYDEWCEENKDEDEGEGEETTN
jgi:hypothetical protein